MKFNCGPEWDERVLNLNPKKKIGVLVSSGLDSTTLLGLLYNNFDVDIKLFNIKTGPNTVKPVINDLLQQMNIDLPLNIIGDGNWHIPMYNHHARIWLAFEEIKQEWDVEELYCGNIQSPREEFFPQFNIHSPEFPKRPWLTRDPFLKNPLEHLEKYHVIDLGRRNNLNHLYATTISCNRYELWNCGQCMGCQELDWAYQQLDYPQSTSLQDLVDKANYDITHHDTKKHDEEWWNDSSRRL